MLPKRNKINKNEFGKLESLPRKKVFSNLFSLVYHKRKDLSPNKISVVVSKKVAKNATDRNKIKRFVYETLDSFGRKNLGISMVFYAKKGILESKDVVIKEVLAEISKIK